MKEKQSIDDIIDDMRATALKATESSEILIPGPTYQPARIIVNRIALLGILDEWDENLAENVRLYQKLNKLINTGTTPEKE